MLAGEVRAAATQDRCHLSGGQAAGEQMPGNPKVHDAPIGTRETLRDGPTADAIVVQHAGLRRACVDPALGEYKSGFAGGRKHPGVLDQVGGPWGQTGAGMQDLDPGGETEQGAARRFAIGEAGEAAEMVPVGAGRIAAVGEC